MDERIGKWLFDIQTAIADIELFLVGKEFKFEAYQKDKMLKRAIERELEIIGEAVNRIVKKDPSYSNKIRGAQNIVGLRNQVIHAYDNISDENIWAILVNHLPNLKADVNGLLAEPS